MVVLRRKQPKKIVLLLDVTANIVLWIDVTANSVVWLLIDRENEYQP